MEMSSMRGMFKKLLRYLFFDNSCSACLKLLDREGFLCSSCLNKLLKEAYLKSYENFYYIFYYDEKIREIITDYKIRNRKALGLDLALIIRKFLEKVLEDERIDIVIPVPISQERLKERGFNQVEYILDILKIKYSRITRGKNTKHMYNLGDYDERMKNVKDAFKNNLNLSDKKILIVDDIVTSGATIKSIIKEIEKKNKNVDIKIFSIAMSRKFEIK